MASTVASPLPALYIYKLVWRGVLVVRVDSLRPYTDLQCIDSLRYVLAKYTPLFCDTAFREDITVIIRILSL